MSRQLMKSTQISVNLSLNIITLIENDTHLVTLPLVQLTPIFYWLWQVSRLVSVIKYELVMVGDDVITAINFISKVFTIGLNSLAFGLGVM